MTLNNITKEREGGVCSLKETNIKRKGRSGRGKMWGN